MGFSKDLIVFDSLTAKDAYFRIKTTITEWETNQVKIVMGAWISREDSKGAKPELPMGSNQEFILDIPVGSEGKTKEEQYLMIKTEVPFFTDAADVLEVEPKEEELK